LIDLLFFILKYTVYSVALVVIILLELAFFGWESVVGTYLSSFFISNMANILFLIIFVVISWFIFSMVTSYLESMYSTERRTMPEAYQFVLNVVRYVFILTLTIVVLFTLLSMAGLQTIAYLVVGLIVLFMVVAVYVIGSTAGRNLVPGLLLMYYKPFEIGDKILLDGNVYTVQEFGLVQTEMRTPDGIFVDIPNSRLISETVVNLSRSKKLVVHAKLTLSPKVPLDRIRSLASSITSQTSEIENIVVEASTAMERGIVYDVKIILPLEADAGRIRTEVIHSFLTMMKEEG
jgi:small-conductance mechanosensitive channel